MGVTFVLVISGILLFCLYITKKLKYWQKYGIPYSTIELRHIWQLMSMQINFAECYYKIYTNNKNHSMVGVYNLISPSLMVLEPELVKTVMQTDFSSFSKNTIALDHKLDPLLSNNPFFTYGDEWTIGRKRLTHAFSGMRLKMLSKNVKLVCEQFENFLKRKLSNTENVEMDLKDLFARFTAQVVASATLDMDGHSFDDDNQNKSFHDVGKSFLHPNTMNNIITVLLFFLPSLSKAIGLRFLPKAADRFFRTKVASILEKKRLEATPKKDFIQLMIELDRMETEKIDLEIMASYVASFFIDGYETSSIVLSFIGFQLATHPEVQEQLHEEIKTVFAKYDGEITYDSLKEMTYMDQVINESLRLLPVLRYFGKICTKEFELRGSDGLICRVEPGMEIIIPVHSLQKDSRYWDNPEKFDPDRFSPDKKQNIEKFAYLPFGGGPRMCMGMRMAVMQMKACLTVLLNKYRLELSSKMQVPLKLTAATVLSAPQGGVWAFIRPI